MTFTIYHLAFIWSWLMTYPRDTWHVTAPVPCHHSNHHINEAHCACASRKSSPICIHYRCQASPARLLWVSTQHFYAQYKIYSSQHLGFPSMQQKHDVILPALYLEDRVEAKFRLTPANCIRCFGFLTTEIWHFQIELSWRKYFARYLQIAGAADMDILLFNHSTFSYANDHTTRSSRGLGRSSDSNNPNPEYPEPAASSGVPSYCQY